MLITTRDDRNIPHFGLSGIISIIIHAKILAPEIGQISMKLRDLGGLIRVSGDIANTKKSELVEFEHVNLAYKRHQSIETQKFSQTIRVMKKRYTLGFHIQDSMVFWQPKTLFLTSVELIETIQQDLENVYGLEQEIIINCIQTDWNLLNSYYEFQKKYQLNEKLVLILFGVYKNHSISFPRYFFKRLFLAIMENSFEIIIIPKFKNISDSFLIKFLLEHSSSSTRIIEIEEIADLDEYDLD